MKPTLDEKMPRIVRSVLFWTVVVPFRLALFAGLVWVSIHITAWLLCQVAGVCK